MYSKASVYRDCYFISLWSNNNIASTFGHSHQSDNVYIQAYIHGIILKPIHNNITVV